MSQAGLNPAAVALQPNKTSEDADTDSSQSSRIKQDPKTPSIRAGQDSEGFVALLFKEGIFPSIKKTLQERNATKDSAQTIKKAEKEQKQKFKRALLEKQTTSTRFSTRNRAKFHIWVNNYSFQSFTAQLKNAFSRLSRWPAFSRLIQSKVVPEYFSITEDSTTPGGATPQLKLKTKSTTSTTIASESQTAPPSSAQGLEEKTTEETTRPQQLNLQAESSEGVFYAGFLSANVFGLLQGYFADLYDNPFHGLAAIFGAAGQAAGIASSTAGSRETAEKKYISDTLEADGIDTQATKEVFQSILEFAKNFPELRDAIADDVESRIDKQSFKNEAKQEIHDWIGKINRFKEILKRQISSNPEFKERFLEALNEKREVPLTSDQKSMDNFFKELDRLCEDFKPTFNTYEEAIIARYAQQLSAEAKREANRFRLGQISPIFNMSASISFGLRTAESLQTVTPYLTTVGVVFMSGAIATGLPFFLKNFKKEASGWMDSLTSYRAASQLMEGEEFQRNLFHEIARQTFSGMDLEESTSQILLKNIKDNKKREVFLKSFTMVIWLHYLAFTAGTIVAVGVEANSIANLLSHAAKKLLGEALGDLFGNGSISLTVTNALNLLITKSIDKRASKVMERREKMLAGDFEFQTSFFSKNFMRLPSAEHALERGQYGVHNLAVTRSLSEEWEAEETLTKALEEWAAPQGTNSPREEAFQQVQDSLSSLLESNSKEAKQAVQSSTELGLDRRLRRDSEATKKATAHLVRSGLQKALGDQGEPLVKTYLETRFQKAEQSFRNQTQQEAYNAYLQAISQGNSPAQARLKAAASFTIGSLNEEAPLDLFFKGRVEMFKRHGWEKREKHLATFDLVSEEFSKLGMLPQKAQAIVTGILRRIAARKWSSESTPKTKDLFESAKDIYQKIYQKTTTQNLRRIFSATAKDSPTELIKFPLKEVEGLLEPIDRMGSHTIALAMEKAWNRVIDRWKVDGEFPFDSEDPQEKATVNYIRKLAEQAATQALEKGLKSHLVALAKKEDYPLRQLITAWNTIDNQFLTESQTYIKLKSTFERIPKQQLDELESPKAHVKDSRVQRSAKQLQQVNLATQSSLNAGSAAFLDKSGSDSENATKFGQACCVEKLEKSKINFDTASIDSLIAKAEAREFTNTILQSHLTALGLSEKQTMKTLDVIFFAYQLAKLSGEDNEKAFETAMQAGEIHLRKYAYHSSFREAPFGKIHQALHSYLDIIGRGNTKPAQTASGSQVIKDLKSIGLSSREASAMRQDLIMLHEKSLAAAQAKREEDSPSINAVSHREAISLLESTAYRSGLRRRKFQDHQGRVEALLKKGHQQNVQAWAKRWKLQLPLENESINSLSWIKREAQPFSQRIIASQILNEDRTPDHDYLDTMIQWDLQSETEGSVSEIRRLLKKMGTSQSEIDDSKQVNNKQLRQLELRKII